MNRRVRNRRVSTPQQNLDSFLDILTNTVGVLMFVGLFVALVAVEAGTIVRTPLVSESRKLARFFEVSRNQIFPINWLEADGLISQELDKLPDCEEPNIPRFFGDLGLDFYQEEIEKHQQCVVNKLAEFQKIKVQTQHYEVSIVGLDGSRYDLRTGVVGETVENLEQGESNFHELLEDFDPQKEFLAFIVRPDSFEAFRTAREVAWQRNFDVGWEPLPEERPIVFGSSGRAVGVQ
ncbi:MAG: hypothetical protein AAGG02_13085 [Cyanobacteria bacterium P01_H01_bin.15]